MKQNKSLTNVIIHCGCYKQGCTVTVNSDSAMSLIGGRYVGVLLSDVWFCRNCADHLLKEIPPGGGVINYPSVRTHL